MATKAAVGMSRHHNPDVAGREAAEQALEKASIAKADFVFLFGSIGYDQHSLVRAVRGATGGAPLTGCSAEGTINGDDADESNFSVVVTAISSDELRWHHGIASGLLEDDSLINVMILKLRHHEGDRPTQIRLTYRCPRVQGHRRAGGQS